MTNTTIKNVTYHPICGINGGNVCWCIYENHFSVISLYYLLQYK
jgi:hypothetical protein